METVNEKQSATLTVEFRDQDGAVVSPSSASYRIDDQSGGIVRETTTLAGSEILLDGDDTAIINPLKSIETRIVTVSYQYGSGKSGTGEYRYQVKNLRGIA